MFDLISLKEYTWIFGTRKLQEAGGTDLVVLIRAPSKKIALRILQETYQSIKTFDWDFIDRIELDDTQDQDKFNRMGNDPSYNGRL